MLDFADYIKTRQEMNRTLDSLYTTRTLKPSLKALPILSSVDIGNFVGLARTEPKLNDYQIKVEDLGDNLYRLSISKEVRKERIIKGSALIDIRDEAWVFLTMNGTYFVRHGIVHLLNSLYPQISRVYLNHYSMLQLLNEVKERYGGDRVVTEFSADTEELSKKGRGRKSVRIAGKTAEKDLRNYSKRQRIWLNKVAYQIVDRDDRSIVESVIYSSGLSRL